VPKNRIKKLREEKHMTQVRLSIELEVTQETVSAYEHGRHNPSCKSLLIMAELFDASIDYILGISPIRDPKLGVIRSEDEIDLLFWYRKLGAIQKGKSLAYMQGMLSE
jgi:transcriptional regulator with XRE-family HTH domain